MLHPCSRVCNGHRYDALSSRTALRRVLGLQQPFDKKVLRHNSHADSAVVPGILVPGVVAFGSSLRLCSNLTPAVERNVVRTGFVVRIPNEECSRLVRVCSTVVQRRTDPVLDNGSVYGITNQTTLAHVACMEPV